MYSNLKQKGFMSPSMYVILAMILIIGVGGFFIHKERQGMLKKIEEQAQTIERKNTEILQLEEVNRRLLSENQTLNRQFALLTEIVKNNDEERAVREKKYRELEVAYKKLGEKLPESLSDDKVCKMTESEAKNSEMRIHYLWNIFQMDAKMINQVNIQNNGHTNPPAK